MTLRCSLVLHRIDKLTSLALHFLPIVITYHLKWFTYQKETGLVNVVLLYFVWVLGYCFINFISAKNKALVQKLSCVNLHFNFLLLHSVYTFLTTILALILYSNFWLDTCFIALIFFRTVWSGACYYMESFCRKYELEL
jgi:hypothetical protein